MYCEKQMLKKFDEKYKKACTSTQSNKMKKFDVATKIKSPIFGKDHYLRFHKKRLYFTFNLMFKFVTISDQTKILDIGTSIFTIFLKRILKNQVYTIDIFSSFKNVLSKEKIVFNKCDLQKDRIPFPSNFFDIILFDEVIEHLQVNPKKVLKEVRRVLKKGGVLILETPNAVYFLNRLKMLFGRNPQEIFMEKDLYRETHFREYTMPELILLLNEVGFTIKMKKYALYYDATYYNTTNLPDFFMIPLKFLKHILVSFLPFLRRAIVVVCKK